MRLGGAGGETCSHHAWLVGMPAMGIANSWGIIAAVAETLRPPWSTSAWHRPHPPRSLPTNLNPQHVPAADLSMLRGIGEDNGAAGDEEEGVIEEGLEDDDLIWETDDAKIQALQAPKQVGRGRWAQQGVGVMNVGNKV